MLNTLLNSPFVSEATRRALTKRLEQAETPPQFFTESELALLQAVALRLAGPMPTNNPIDMARPIDERLATGKSNGWRYDDMPTDGDTYRIGLQGIEQHAQVRFKRPFIELLSHDQDAVLRDVQAGNVPGDAWQQVRADRFFEELLTEVTEYVYAHPHKQELIGYVGYADLS